MINKLIGKTHKMYKAIGQFPEEYVEYEVILTDGSKAFGRWNGLTWTQTRKSKVQSPGWQIQILGWRYIKN